MKHKTVIENKLKNMKFLEKGIADLEEKLTSKKKQLEDIMTLPEPWMSNLVEQRKILVSPLMVIESNDMRRYRALLFQKPSFFLHDEKEGRWLVLESWTNCGLKKVTVERNGMTYGRTTYEEIINEPMGNLYSLMSRIMEELTKERTVLVIKNLLMVDEYISNMLLSIATDMEIMYRGSTVILFVENREILPKSLLKQTRVITPPKSTMMERMIDLENAIEAGVLNEMGEKEKESAIQLLEGLNLDQIDAILTELSIRNNCRMSVGLLRKLKTNMGY